MAYNSLGRSIMKTILFLFLAVTISLLAVQAQTTFDVQAYKTFLQNTKTMTLPNSARLMTPVSLW